MMLSYMSHYGIDSSPLAIHGFQFSEVYNEDFSKLMHSRVTMVTVFLLWQCYTSPVIFPVRNAI